MSATWDNKARCSNKKPADWDDKKSSEKPKLTRANKSKSKKPVWQNLNNVRGSSDSKVKALVICFDIEHTGHGPYQSDVLSIAANASILDAEKKSLTIVPQFGFKTDVYTTKDVSQHCPTAVKAYFTPEVRRNGRAFSVVINAMFDLICKTKQAFCLSSVWLVGHDVYKSEAAVLDAQCARNNIDFAALLAAAGVTVWVDTLQLARLQPQLADLDSKSLGSIYLRLFSAELESAHDAKSDADATQVIKPNNLKYHYSLLSYSFSFSA